MTDRRINDYPLRYLARVVIEFKTAFLIAAGSDDSFADDTFVADANGLPTLPGSSLAGVLRRQLTEPDADAIFGKKDDGSRLTVSWGCIHDSNDKPVEGLIIPRSLIDDDPVLRQAQFSMVRDHVCINRRGVAAKGGGKFDERCVDAGHRFTFEMLLEGNCADQGNWDTLLKALAGNTLRLGGKTRRGYGAFKVENLETDKFNLLNDTERVAFCSHPIEFAAPSPMPERLVAYAGQPSPAEMSIVINLKPEGFWMVGGGSGADADMTPVEAMRVIWSGDPKRGNVRKDILVPGTAIKGPLSHRVAYYYNALKGAFADKPSQNPDEPAAVGTLNKAVSCLFGVAKNDKKNEDGQAGRVFIDDIYLDQGTLPQDARKIINHVSIDRFTGGARTLTGALFSEQPMYKGCSIPLRIIIKEKAKIMSEPDVRKAFDLAVQDLSEAQLAIGSGDGRGNGYFKAQATVTIPWLKKTGESRMIENLNNIFDEYKLNKVIQASAAITPFDPVTDASVLHKMIVEFKPHEGWLCLTDKVVMISAECRLPVEGIILSGELVCDSKSLHIRQTENGWSCRVIERRSAGDQIMYEQTFLSIPGKGNVKLKYETYWKIDTDTARLAVYQPHVSRFSGFVVPQKKEVE